MKFFQRSVFFVIFFGIFTTTTHAQFSLLPYADPEADCAVLLNLYEVNRKIPTVMETATTKREEANRKSLEAQASVKVAEDLATRSYQEYNEAIKKAQKSKSEKDLGDALKFDAASRDLENALNDARKAKTAAEAERDTALGEEEKKRDDNSQERDNLLGCAIKTGKVSLAMIPYFITYIINFLLSLSGLISVLFIVIGGYQYVYGGLGEGSKDKAKKTITHALMGLAIAILAWSIVNVIINAITG